MNEHGVAVSDMSVEDAQPPRDSAKPDVLHSTAMRLILDNARSTQEAVALLRHYNVHFVETTCHLMIADAQGESVVVEFTDGELRTVPTEENWQVSTNHPLWGRSEAENDADCSRYRTASERLAQAGGTADLDAMMQVMAAVSAPDWTMWTSAYNLSTGEFQVAFRRQFDEVWTGRLAVRPD